jgi:hypothetical protein
MARRRRRRNSETALVRSAEFIGWALGGLEREILQTRQRLASLTEQANKLRAKIGARAGRAAAAVGSVAPASLVKTRRRRRRRRMSAEARKRISERMTKRWAEWRKKHSK